MPIKVTGELSEIINLQDFTESMSALPHNRMFTESILLQKIIKKKNQIIFLSDNVWVGKQWKCNNIMRNSCKQHPKHELWIGS